MTDATDNPDEKLAVESQAAETESPQGPPLYLRASLADLVDFDFEAPIRGSQAADSNELSDRFWTSAGTAAPDENHETPAVRVFSMLAAATGMHLKSQDANEPFGPMVVRPDGLRSAAPSDFRGEPIAMLSEMAARVRTSGAAGTPGGCFLVA